jgi:hypothetical protein
MERLAVFRRGIVTAIGRPFLLIVGSGHKDECGGIGIDHPDAVGAHFDRSAVVQYADACVELESVVFNNAVGDENAVFDPHPNGVRRGEFKR